MIENLLSGFSETHRIFTYLLIFLGMFIEGEFILLLAGILIRSGHIDFFDTLVISFVAVIIHDSIFWLIGQKLAQAGKKKFLFFDLEKIVSFIQANKNMGSGTWLFFSKFAWNLNRLILISSGCLKTTYKQLMRYSVPAALLWSFTFISLGYFFADQLEILKKDVKMALIFFTLFLATLIILEKWLQKKVFSGVKNGNNSKPENNFIRQQKDSV